MLVTPPCIFLNILYNVGIFVSLFRTFPAHVDVLKTGILLVCVTLLLLVALAATGCVVIRKSATTRGAYLI